MKRSKKIDDNEITKPNIIIGLDVSLSCLARLLLDKDKDKFLYE